MWTFSTSNYRLKEKLTLARKIGEEAQEHHIIIGRYKDYRLEHRLACEKAWANEFKYSQLFLSSYDQLLEKLEQGVNYRGEPLI